MSWLERKVRNSVGTLFSVLCLYSLIAFIMGEYPKSHYSDDTNIGYTKQERQQLKSLIIKDLVETGDIPRISIEDLQ